MFGFKCISCRICAVICGLFLVLNINGIFATTSADSWLMFARETKKILGKCYPNNPQWADSWRCIQYNSLLLLDDMTAADTIPLTNVVEFVRLPPEESPRNLTFEKELKARNYVEIAPKDFSWYNEVMDRLNRIIQTHKLMLAFGHPVNDARARHRQRMFPMMVFGMCALGMVVIPIMFHIMMVMSGTALLFAKMALLMASVTGSKRLIPQGVHYGLHQDHYYGPAGWERQEGYNNQYNNYRRH